ncbi:MAG TPA: DUF1559 domain-containing protein [Urbifossiella sp.]|jgi:prepilin-type processing-associated H-X9-DG protein/prepilin-type N-terminal cleavage/methylation domain-containing protein|nr:DUF1559 domain-containing protein [Urbifossiella sp.]
MPRQPRPALTLVEVLVALAILAILVGLTLAAVQQARAAGARAGCANNLRQIALALHQFHDAEGAFPPAVKTRIAGGTEPYLSWRGRLLPYIEQMPLWQQTLAAYRVQPNPFTDPVHVGRVTVLRVYACPADGRLATPWEVTTRPGHTVRTAFGSYLGNSGRETHLRDGILFPNSRVRLTDVADGTSTTLLAGERPPSKDLIYGWWYAGSGQGAGYLDAHLGVADLNRKGPSYHGCPAGPYGYRPPSPDDDCSAFRFWSTHPGGANFALADGSVRFLPYSIEPILRSLASRAGGEIVDLP